MMAALDVVRRTLAGDEAPCIVRACDDPREAGRVMCTTHWATVPPVLQQLLDEATADLNEGRPGAQRWYLGLVRAARTAVEQPGQQLVLPIR